MFAKRSYAGSNSYISGDAWFICDRCSQRHRRSAMLTEWTGLKVDRKCLDPRPPQMQPPDVWPEGIPFFDARPPQDKPDRLMDDTALSSGWGGMGVQAGVTYPGGQNGQPGALSPQPVYESVDQPPLSPQPGNPTVGLPLGANVLADDVTFITGVIPAPENTNSTVPDPVPEPNP